MGWRPQGGSQMGWSPLGGRPKPPSLGLAGGCKGEGHLGEVSPPPRAYINPLPPPLSFTPWLIAFSSLSLSSRAVPEYWNGLGGRVLHLKARRCAGGSYGSALPSSAAPLIRRNGGEVFFAQACGASRCYTCGTRHQAIRLHDLEVGVDVRRHRQRLCGNVSRSPSSKV